jgi:hypothetical protein
MELLVIRAILPKSKLKATINMESNYREMAQVLGSRSLALHIILLCISADMKSFTYQAKI